MEGKWSTLTKEEQIKNEIYQKGYEDGRKCMRLHMNRMQKKIDKLEENVFSDKNREDLRDVV